MSIPRSTTAVVALFVVLIAGCRRTMPEEGTWSGTVELAEGTRLPFRMTLDLRSTKPIGSFLVGNEQVPIPEISMQGDTLILGFSEYGAEMRGMWDGSRLSGVYKRFRVGDTRSFNFTASLQAPVETESLTGSTSIGPPV